MDDLDLDGYGIEEDVDDRAGPQVG